MVRWVGRCFFSSEIPRVSMAVELAGIIDRVRRHPLHTRDTLIVSRARAISSQGLGALSLPEIDIECFSILLS
jgi:hypothetical protein